MFTITLSAYLHIDQHVLQRQQPLGVAHLSQLALARLVVRVVVLELAGERVHAAHERWTAERQRVTG